MSNPQMVFMASIMIQTCSGGYWPSIGWLRGRYFLPEVRSVTITLTRWVIHLLLIFYFMITTYACVQALIGVFYFAFNIVEFSRYVSSRPFFGLSTRVLQWPCWRVAPSMPLQCLSSSKSLRYVYCCDEWASEWVSHFLIFLLFCDDDDARRNWSYRGRLMSTSTVTMKKTNGNYVSVSE